MLANHTHTRTQTHKYTNTQMDYLPPSLLLIQSALTSNKRRQHNKNELRLLRDKSYRYTNKKKERKKKNASKTLNDTKLTKHEANNNNFRYLFVLNVNTGEATYVCECYKSCGHAFAVFYVLSLLTFYNNKLSFRLSHAFGLSASMQ